MSHGPRYLPSMSKDRVAGLCFGATFAIAAFSLGLQFVQDWLGVWDDPGTVNHPRPSGSGGSSATSPPSQPARGGDLAQSRPEA